MKHYLSCLILSAVVLSCSAKVADTPVVPQPSPSKDSWETTTWDFNNINGWYYYTHDKDQDKEYYSIKDGILSITTRGNTMDRNKLHSNSSNYGEGVYTWRVYVPEIEPHAQVSVGAFIYADDTHELDFEIGYGKQEARESCGVGEGELVACLTNQALPFNSTYVKILPGWHECSISMDVVDNLYHATWEIDGVVVKTLPLKFGPSTRFMIACSVENLKFMGDHMPTRDHTAQFDWVKLKAPKK